MSTFSASSDHQRLATLVISYSKGLGQFTEPAEQQLLTLYTLGRFTLDEVVYSLQAGRAQRSSARFT